MEKKNDPRRRIRQIQVPDQDIRPMEGRERKRNTSRAAKSGAGKTTGTRNARTGPSSGNRLRPVEAPVKRPASKAQSRKQKARRRRRRTIGHILQAVLVVALIVVLFFVIRNFGDANKLNNKGLQAYEAGNYEEAIDYFDQALSHDGGNVDYHINKAMAQLELKLYDDVSATLDEAEARAGDGEEQLVDRARGILFLSRGNYQEAIDAFDRALDGKESRFSSRQIDILYYKAEAQDRAGLYVDAVMTYGQIIDSKASADAYMLRGLEYVKVGDSTSAENDLREAIKRDKKNYDIYFALSWALNDQGRTEEGTEVLKEALELGGNSGEALTHQGNIYVALGDYESAKERFDKALGKKNAEANLGLANMYAAQEQYDEALPYYEAYVGEVTDNASAYNAYGTCLMAVDDYEKAQQVFTAGVALNNRQLDQILSKNQIAAAERAGDWSSALEYINIYLTKYADDAEAVREKTFIQTRIR